MGIAADISLIVVMGLALGAVAHRLGQPLLLGYIAAGVILGPHTSGITISDPHEVELLAEIGIALLLFSIGIEFSFDALKSVRRIALLGTAIQMSLSGLFGWALARAMGFGQVEALWLGALISVSSTMVVLKTLAGRGRMGTLSSRVMLGMLIAQDLAVIPLMIVMPQLSGPNIDAGSVALAIGRSFAVLGILVIAGRRIVPWLMHRVVSWGSRELFVLTVITLGLGIGYLNHQLGLSYALGAFIAGLVLSESEYGHQALSDVIPLRDLFGLLFFATVGILFDPVFLVEHAGQVALLVTGVLLVKGLIFGVVTRALGYRNIVPIATALTMGQIGEFSFLLAQVGVQAGAIDEEIRSLVVSTAVLSMVLTPYLARLAGPIYEWRRRRAEQLPESQTPAFREGSRPVVIAGAGRVGQRLARLLAGRDVECVLIDFDQRRVQAARERGHRVVFGDAAQAPVLRAAGVAAARLVLVTVPGAVDARAVTARIRELDPSVPIVVRSDTIEDVRPLLELGVRQVVQPEFEAALAMAHEALLELQVDELDIQVQLTRERIAEFGPGESEPA